MSSVVVCVKIAVEAEGGEAESKELNPGTDARQDSATNEEAGSLADSELALEIETCSLILKLKNIEESTLAKIKSETVRKADKVRAELSSVPPNSALSDTVKAKAKQELLDMCMEHMIEVQADEDTKKILTNIKLGYNKLIENYVKAVAIGKARLEVGKAAKKELQDLKEDFKDSLNTIQRLTNELKEQERGKREMERRFEREKGLIKAKAQSFQSQEPKKPHPQSVVEHAQKPEVKQTRGLSHKMLKELIKDIYASKQDYDLQCLSNNNPKKSMDQYLYTYLKTHSETRGNLIEWTQAILSHLEKYSSDPEITLFSRILRNECEEAFQYKMAHTKSEIEKLVKEKIGRKNMLEAEYEEYIKKTNAAEELWRELVNKVCDAEDRELVLEKMRGRMQQTAVKDAQNLLLEYVLGKHEIDIKKFIVLFRQVDKTGTGTLNHYEFKELLRSLGFEFPSKAFNRMIETLDPCKCQKIIFSDCLSLFETVSFNHMRYRSK